jgi:hypothetical protein
MPDVSSGKTVTLRVVARKSFIPGPRPRSHATRPHPFVSAISLLLVCLLLFPLGLSARQDTPATPPPDATAIPPQDIAATAEQPPEHRPLGSLTSAGEVYVNGVHATADMTVFTGDTMRTGGDGSATFTIGGQGSIKASSNTQLDFSPNPLFIADLKSGMVVMSTVPGAPNMKVRAGTFVVVAETGDADTTAPETACQIQHLADGSFQITSVTGSVGVIALEGPETVFIKDGQSVSVTPAGELSQTTTASGTVVSDESANATPAPRKKKAPVGWILLGVVGAGAAGAVAALAGHGSSSSPISPSSP